MPVFCAISAMAFAANSGCELIPVPTAVPPSGSSRSAVDRLLQRTDAQLGLLARSRPVPAPAESAWHPANVSGRSSRPIVFVGLGIQVVVRCSSDGASDSLIAMRGADVHRRGNHVVGALLHVDVIVGMDRVLAAALAGGRSRWPGRRSPRWRSCWSRCPSRSGKYRRRTARRACRRSTSWAAC